MFPIGIAHRFLEKCLPKRKSKYSIQFRKQLAPALSALAMYPFSFPCSRSFQLLKFIKINSDLQENLQVKERSSSYCGFHCHRCYSEHISSPTAAFHIFSIQTYFWLFLSPPFWKQEQPVFLLALSQEQAAAEQLNSRVQPHSQEPCGDKAAYGVLSPRLLLTEHLHISVRLELVQFPWLYAGDVLHCYTFLNVFWLHKKSGCWTNPFHRKRNFTKKKKALFTHLQRGPFTLHINVIITSFN